MSPILITECSFLIPLNNTIAITIADSLIDENKRTVRTDYIAYREDTPLKLLKALKDLSLQYKILTGDFLRIF